MTLPGNPPPSPPPRYHSAKVFAKFAAKQTEGALSLVRTFERSGNLVCAVPLALTLTIVNPNYDERGGTETSLRDAPDFDVDKRFSTVE